MSNLYQQSLLKASNIVSKSNDRDLSTEDYNQRVYQNTAIIIPTLLLKQTNVSIKEQQISFRNAPPGIMISMSGPNTVEYALYEIPIDGGIELFATICKRLIDRTSSYIDSNKFCYREYSNNKISGNERLIDEIRERVVGLTNKANGLLISFKEEVDTFHESQLKPAIKGFIEAELRRRELKSDSESKLNPFA